MVKNINMTINDNDYDREPCEQIEQPGSTRKANLNQNSNFLPPTILLSSLNTNFEDSIFEINPGTGEAPVPRKGEKAKADGVDSELKRLLQQQERGDGRKVGNNLDMVGGGWEEHPRVGGTWEEHQDGGGELRRLLVGAGPLHGRNVENNLGAGLHGRTMSRQQDWEIST